MKVTAIHAACRRALPALIPAAALLFAQAPALAAPKAAAPKGDAVHGEQVYARCKACHSLDAGKNLIGPSLKGIVGRKAATVAGFNYSPAMKGSGITWTPQQLSDFLTAPMKKVSGTRMGFVGLPNQQDRDDIIAYLAKN